MTDAAVELQTLGDSFRHFLSQECPVNQAAAIATNPHKAKEIWQGMADLGWFGLLVAEDHGGLAMGYPELARLYIEAGRCLVPVPILQAQLALELVERCATKNQKTRWLTDMLSGEMRVGAHPAIATHGLPVLSNNHISGTWLHVLNADFFDFLFMPVLVENEIRYLCIETAQLSVTNQSGLDMTRSLCEVTAVNLIVDEASLVTPVDDHFLLDHGSLALACDCAGGAAAILDITVAYMKTRTQFNRPIGSFQALKHRAAHWKVQQEAISALALGAAAAIEDRSVWCSNARFAAAQTYADIAGDAIQLHGGIGFTWEYACHLFFKRAKLNEVIYGDAAWHKDRVARLMMESGQWVATT